MFGINGLAFMYIHHKNVFMNKALVMSAIQSGCHLVPLGYISPEKDAEKKQANTNFNLEWSVKI